MPYYLGFDIGASKSHGVIADQTGKVIAFDEVGPGNHETIGWDGLTNILNQITGKLLSQSDLTASQISGAGFGLAGLDWPSQLAPHLEIISTLGLECPITAVNDAILGIAAGTTSGWGISIISGTGENCWGVDQDHHYAQMTGGDGLMAEYGGAGSIVSEAVRAVAKAWGKRGPETQLSEVFIDHFGAKNLDELLEGIMLGKYSPGAGDVRPVFRTAKAGDQVAIDTIHWAGEELADMIISIARKLNFNDVDFEVVMIGSTFKGGPLLVNPMQAKVERTFPRARFIRLEAPPVVGAVLLAMDWKGNPEIRQRLIATTSEMSGK